jgi:transposase
MDCVSIAAKIGCSGERLRNWVRQAQRDRGERAGLSTSERERLKALERDVRELRQANEILRKASAYFAQAHFTVRWFSARENWRRPPPIPRERTR